MDHEAEDSFERLLDALGILGAGETLHGRDALPLRMPVQDVYRSEDRRIIVGRIETGRLSVGDPYCSPPRTRPRAFPASRP